MNENNCCYRSLQNRQCCRNYNTPCYEYGQIRPDFDVSTAHCGKCGQGICVNNNPVIHVCVDGAKNGTETPRPFLSSYFEALGEGQTVARNGNIVFDADSVDSVGNAIELDASGTIFTINRTGLYHVEWTLNVAATTTAPSVVGILENGQPASGGGTVTHGNFSSGTVVQVDTVPFTLSLHNYTDALSIENVAPYRNSAASIRIVRFADGPIV